MVGERSVWISFLKLLPLQLGPRKRNKTKNIHEIEINFCECVRKLIRCVCCVYVVVRVHVFCFLFDHIPTNERGQSHNHIFSQLGVNVTYQDMLTVLFPSSVGNHPFTPLFSSLSQWYKHYPSLHLPLKLFFFYFYSPFPAGSSFNSSNQRKR